MWETLGTLRDLGRLQEIASVLVRYGFGDVVRRIGLANVLERAGRLVHAERAGEFLHLQPAQRLRRALEELGPTFIKLGQVLATRVDLLAADWIVELGALQSAVPALDFEQVRAQVREDLGAEPEAVFDRIDTAALAGASLAQTHRAWLADGTPVILKIRRPGIVEVVEADLRLLARLADIAQARLPDLRRFRPDEVVKQFTASLRAELDFAAECRNAEQIAANFAQFPGMVVPRVYWTWTSARLNVQDFVQGLPGGDMAALDAAGLDRKALARTGAQIVMKMVLEDGLFHADPHPGNLFYLLDGRIALIDFGMVGRVSQTRRLQIARLLHGLVTQQPEAVADILLDWAGDEGQGEADEAVLLADITTFTDQFHGVPLKDLRIGRMLTEISTLLRVHALVLPPDLALMIKALLTLEGLGRQLDPDFDMAGQARPFLERAMLAHYAPRHLARRGGRMLGESLDLLGELPRDVRRLVRAAGRGRMKLEITSLRSVGAQLNHAVNRLTMGIVTAALIVGSAIVMNSAGGVPSAWRTGLGLAGFIGAAVCGVGILLSIWRSGRR